MHLTVRKKIGTLMLLCKWEVENKYSKKMKGEILKILEKN